MIDEYNKLHADACTNKKYWYIDPDTGYRVLTSYFLIKREYCCRSACRHCPYGFDNELKCHIVTGVPAKRTLHDVYSLHKHQEVIVIPTDIEDLVLKSTDELMECDFHTLVGKLVKFTGYRDRGQFYVKSVEVINENKTS